MTHTFIGPMLATPMPDLAPKFGPGVFVAEEKFDGHRLTVSVFDGSAVAWSRYGKERALAPHVLADVLRLPNGVYDGELIVDGMQSWAVIDHQYTDRLVFVVFVVFDVLDLLGVSTINQTYAERRAYIDTMFDHESCTGLTAVRRSTVYPLSSHADIQPLLETVWARNGEGLILKRVTGRYHPGERPVDGWIKMKQCQHATLEVIGFIPSKGKIQDRGPFATVVLRDAAGNVTTAKTLNNHELDRFTERSGALNDTIGIRMTLVGGRRLTVYNVQHPDVGRKLVIEFQGRTPVSVLAAHPELALSSYRHVRWDRWADE